MSFLFSPNFLFNWLFSHGIKIAGVLIVALVSVRVGKVFISKYLKSLFRKGVKFKKISAVLEENRIDTVNKVVFSIFKAIIWIIALITILPEFGVEIGPLLAGVGVTGLALGLGARSLIQDYLSGLFILLEDQYRVGEEVEIASQKGQVEDFNLRRTVLRDSNGILHYIPNSQIKKVSNFSRK
ncbi:mechanosensitive ion channel [bacterium]|nr:mechanosensitive ion channel [bacterium]